MLEMFELDFMRQAFIAAVLVGAAAPAVGVFLVQRRLSLIGDGLGHVALAGVAIGVLTGAAPTWTALVAAILAACVIEAIRLRGNTNADVALAVMFYGGIALGVVLLAKAPADQGASMTTYLFGSILTTQADELWQFAVLAVIAIGATTVLRKRLFAVANDEEFARAVGLPVMRTNLLLSVLTSVTVVLSMRVIGLLLISALMILPNATGQLLGRSFRASTTWAVVVGVLCGAVGVAASYQLDTPSGGTVVLTAVLIFIVVSLVAAARRAIILRRARAGTHPHRHYDGCGHDAVLHADHVDYLHDGHHHAAHDDHWDEHAPTRETSGRTTHEEHV
ncbi:metal ABC transporter permease [Yimella lutea]|uniref:Zinc transport system permease protein n=1 Tax=Yimella lutea TaxID=587872 RepID=A0A542EIK4_9MICO|nr:metal ABC transporter permease [Yimella lutea]MCG8654998.1 metal ABC transporter permease [Yimella sp. NH-Cas1]TQJ15170.1 zinc transport system permease protein [Yimella lutea]